MEHFKEVLIRPDPEITPDITEAEVDLDINLKTPTKEEVLKVIKSEKQQGSWKRSAKLFNQIHP